MESKALVKSTNINVACRFFVHTPSRILRMVNICEVVVPRKNNYRRRLRRWHSDTGKYTHQAKTLLHSLERAAAGIGLYANAHKTEYMCYDQTGDISTLDGTPLKLVDKFTYLGSSVASTEKDNDTSLTSNMKLNMILTITLNITLNMIWNIKLSIVSNIISNKTLNIIIILKLI